LGWCWSMALMRQKEKDEVSLNSCTSNWILPQEFSFLFKYFNNSD
jgi:hypothetical protein